MTPARLHSPVWLLALLLVLPSGFSPTLATTRVGVSTLSSGLGTPAFTPSAALSHLGKSFGYNLMASGASIVAEGTDSLSFSTADSWGNPATLADHFARHGADFGATSADEYAAQASQFFQRSQAAELPTKIDANGVIRVYDPATNEFGAFNPNGTTRTYFAPNAPNNGYATNWDYWLAQPGSAP